MENSDKNRKVTVLSENGFDKYAQLKELSFEDQIFRYYTGRVPTSIHKVIIVEDDDKIYLGNYHYIIKKGKSHLYLLKNSYIGFTYTKSGRATSRVKVWSGSTLHEMQYIDEFLKHLGHEWWNEFGHLGRSLLTPGLLGMIIKGNITNPRDYCKYYIKNCLRLDVSPELLFKSIKLEKRIQTINRRGATREINQSILDMAFNHKNTFAKVLELSTNPNEFIARLSTEEFRNWFFSAMLGEGDVGDMIFQASALNKKIDFSWSLRRLAEVHQEWTGLMMEKELGLVDEYTYEYEGELSIPEDWQLITTEKELFTEGQRMHHCVYGRKNSVKAKTCFVLNAKIEGTQLTVLVSKDPIEGKWIVNQQRAVYNRQVDKDKAKYVKEIIGKSVNQQFFSDNGSQERSEDNIHYMPEEEEEALMF